MAKTNFSDGNASQGVLGTVVTAEFMNALFETNGGHKHDGVDDDGHAGKINLATETEGQLPATSVDLSTHHHDGVDAPKVNLSLGADVTGVLPASMVEGGGAGNGTIYAVVDGGGVALGAGIVGDISLPFAGTIIGYTLLADQVGDLVLDIWKDTYANFPPTVADTITAAAKPTLVAASKTQDSVLAGWNKVLAAGDVLRFVIDSVATITRFSLAITYAKS